MRYRALAAAAHAHHGVANCDLNKDIALEGVITSVEFVNPRSWLHFAPVICAAVVAA